MSKKKNLFDKLNDKLPGGEIMPISGNSQKIKVVPTGVKAIDEVLGGGVPVGKIILITGDEGSGKTSVAKLIAKAFQEHDKRPVVFVDAEFALNLDRAEIIGVDLSRLYMSQPDWAESAANTTIEVCKNGSASLVILDSIASAPPMTETEGDMADSNVGVAARLWNKFFRVVVPAASSTNTTVVAINQQRVAVGVMFGPNETYPGGKAQIYACFIHLKLTAGKQIKRGETVVGKEIHVTTQKNKLGKPRQRQTIPFLFEGGFDNGMTKLNNAIEAGEVEQKGAYFTFSDGTKIQGRAKAEEYITNGTE